MEPKVLYIQLLQWSFDGPVYELLHTVWRWIGPLGLLTSMLLKLHEITLTDLHGLKRFGLRLPGGGVHNSLKWR